MVFIFGPEHFPRFEQGVVRENVLCRHGAEQAAIHVVERQFVTLAYSRRVISFDRQSDGNRPHLAGRQAAILRLPTCSRHY